ncbi:unnamed protein product [Angiostrongylus costaricensis]|uniref:MFS domain-containing protein n=1 Tax=Angiostrongylus costaricensis TaxID=334426 RepID=A0A0R3PPV9_ANGCS|nr:unnamed protein product [Angiostrongylus costaricensis]
MSIYQSLSNLPFSRDDSKFIIWSDVDERMNYLRDNLDNDISNGVFLGGGFNFGYQLLITNPAQEAFIQFLNISYMETHGVQQNRETLEFIWGVIVSMFFWGATLGSLLIQTIADWFGRRNGVIVMFIVQIVSLLIVVISYFTTSYIIYSISRLVLGVAISVSLGIGPMFIIECSPPACRGMISMATGFMIQLGLVAGSITAMPELSAGSEPNKKSCELICILSFCYRNESRSAVDRCSECQQRGSTAQSVRNLQMVNAFAFEILLNVGLNGLQASLANIVICLMALETWIGWCVVVAISIFNLVFATGPGPVCFLVPGELVGHRARAAAYTWVNIILNGVRSALIAVYFPFRALLGGPLSYFLLFFAPCVITVAICYYWLPETSGRTPEQARSDVDDLPRICGTTKKSDRGVNEEPQLMSSF